MAIFDLLFIGIVLGFLAVLGMLLISALRGEIKQGLKTLALYGAFLVFYAAVGILVSLASPQRVMVFGENRCFDDWCIAVEQAKKILSTGKTEYQVTLRLSNQARRADQRENGMQVYLLDEKGRRFDPLADPSSTPINILLQPEQSINIDRSFNVSGASGQLVLVLGHSGWSRFPGIFIIGDDSSLFHKSTIVRLP